MTIAFLVRNSFQIFATFNTEDVSGSIVQQTKMITP